MKQHAVLAVAVAVSVLGVLSQSPIPQDPTYHLMADQRDLFGISNGLNVLSNLPFLIIGAMGLAAVFSRETGGKAFRDRWRRWPYAALFIGVALTAFGSAYYHLAPDNARLVWDRLPVTVGFMGLLTAVLAERVCVRLARVLFLPLLVIGAGSVGYWHLTEVGGAGDLRFYGLVQFGTLLVVALLLLLYPAREPGTRYLVAGLAAYAAAKGFEMADAQILALGQIVSGHTLKHISAAVGVRCIVGMIRVRGRSESAIDQSGTTWQDEGCNVVRRSLQYRSEAPKEVLPLGGFWKWRMKMSAQQMSWVSTRGRRAAIAGVLAGLLSLQSAHAAGLLIADGGFGGVLAIEEHSVKVTVNSGIAVTEVTQVFRNTENRQVEALYTFPVPKGATVANFSMWIDGKEMVGEVVEKKRAREIYNNYKQQRKDPGLLEQTDYKTFEMRIFPIAPNARPKVQITYYQELDVDNDWVTYVYPLSTVTSKNADQKVSGKFALSFDAKSEVPIVEMESPSHGDDFVVAKHTKHYAQASLETSGADLGRDVVLAYRVERPRTGIDVITSKAAGEDGYFYLTLTAGDELAPHNTGMDYVFVLDVSGSMAQDGKLQTSRESIEAFIKGLEKDDRFDIITFNVVANPLFRELRPASQDNLAQGIGFLESQLARGGTVLGPAITTAYRYRDPDRPLNVVILSDGLTEQRDRAELLSLIRSRPSNARVFCIGVGNDVDRPLLEQMAEDAGGLAEFISRADNFTRTAQAFRRKLLRPVGTNVEMTFDGIEVYDLEPKSIPNLYHGMPVRLYGRYRKGGTGKVTVRADLDGSELRRTTSIDFPTKESETPEIERMWAFRKVQRLLKDADRTGSREAVISEVVHLGEAYSIVTEYTSFLVLENDAEYQRWKLERRNALRVQRDRKRERELDAQLASIRKTGLHDIGPAADVGSSTPSAAARPGPQPVFTQPPPASGGGTRGGGALDPVTGGIALGLGALGLLRRRQMGGKER